MARGMKVMTLFVNGDELGLFLKAANDAGLKPYQWARKVLVEAAGGTVPPSKKATVVPKAVSVWEGVTPATYEAHKRAHPEVDWVRWEQAVLAGDLDGKPDASPLDPEWVKGDLLGAAKEVR